MTTLQAILGYRPVIILNILVLVRILLITISSSSSTAKSFLALGVCLFLRRISFISPFVLTVATLTAGVEHGFPQIEEV